MSNSKPIKSSLRAVRVSRPTKTGIDRAWPGSAKYVVAATAVAVSGGIIAGGFMMRKQLLSAANSVASHLNMGDILGLVGVQRRRGIRAQAVPALGVLAAAAMVGAGLAYWLLPFSDECSNEASTGQASSMGADAMSPHA